MALQGPLPVEFGRVFPHGAYATGAVEPLRDFDESTRERFVQARDRHSGELVWQVDVIDADPSVNAKSKTVSVKISAPVQPVLPEAPAGLPFTPVEFESMTATPYVDQRSGRLAYSFRASGVVAPKVGVKPSAGKDPSPGRDAGKDAA